MHDSISQLWLAISVWFDQNKIEEFSSIQTAQTVDALSELVTTIGKGTPKELLELYGLMDGVDPTTIGGVGLFPPLEAIEMPYHPLAIEQICADWEMLRELLEMGDFDDSESEHCDLQIKNEFWNVNWIPFASNGGGDYYCIDLDPSDAGSFGQVISHNHETGDHKFLANSLNEYLCRIVYQLKEGHLVFKDGGLIQAVSD